MWIRTQSKQQIINSDRVINIFIDKSGTKIMANTTREDAFSFILGEYKDRDTCLEILEYILMVIGTKMSETTMPLGGDVESWEKAIEELSRIYIVQDFRR